MVHIQIFTNPVPKARARFNIRSRGVYTPSKTKAYESHICREAKKVIKTPMTGAIELKIIFNFVRAKSNKQPFHIKRPDLDNLIKAVSDGLNGVAFKDDSQIISLYSEKNYSDRESVEIFIKEIE